MFNRIVFFKFLDKSQLVQLRGKIYFTKYTMCSVNSVNSVNSANSVNSVQAVYSAELPPSLFFGCKISL